jgi:beta-fructofuranosidase
MELASRPRYHFLPLANWMNDPNGLIQWKGVYHLFYQYNPDAPGFGLMHWGHASSTDLVHWRHLPIALAPTPLGPDKDGSWSGCAVDDGGVPTLVFTGVRPECQCLATSDDDMVYWDKDDRNPVISGPPEGLDVTGFRDPCVWREDGAWWMVLGSGFRDVGGAILLYRSDDLHRWEYRGPLFEGRTDRGEGHNWECPNYLRLGDRRLLILSPQPFLEARFFVGDQADGRFTPASQGLLDHGGWYYAPQAFTDERGRRILFGWLLEGRTEEARMAAGWAGVQSLPRELSLGDHGTLEQRPVPELTGLRRNERHIAGREWTGTEVLDIQGRSLELRLELAAGGAGTVGIEVLRSPGGEERTSIVADPGRGVLAMDTRGASRDPGAAGRLAEAPLPPGETLRLRVFIDQSVIEVFANDRVCLTGRAYPTRGDSCGLALVATGGTARLEGMNVWDMAGIWSSRGQEG